MPTDASGPTTPLGIPTYATSADAPSGLGFNNTMQVIDSLIAGRLKVTGSPSANQAVVWNGSAWVPALVANANIDPAAAIALSKLAGYPGDGTKFAAGDGTWKTAGQQITLAQFTSLVDIVNTGTETDLFGTQGSGYSVPGGTLGTSKKLRIRIIGDVAANGANPTANIRFYYGATKLWDQAITINNFGTTAHYGTFYDLELAARGATNSQIAGGVYFNSQGNSNAFSTAGQDGIEIGFATEDSTVAKNLRVTWQWNNISTAYEMRAYYTSIELI